MTEDILSGFQLDKLGDRLRDGPLLLGDLQQLRHFLDTLEPFAENTFARIRGLVKAHPGLAAAQITRRNLKTVRSTVAKLRRQSTTLRQIQDLVGCRVVVPDIIDQDVWMTALTKEFPGSHVADRRFQPQHGYRAIHIIVREANWRFEIQLRTVLQDKWANIVEKIDDRFNFALKYGIGDQSIMDRLKQASRLIADVERFQRCFGVRPPSGLGKAILLTYVADYDRAFREAWPAAESAAREAWQAALNSAAEQGSSWPINDARNYFELLRENHQAWSEVDLHASRYLRLMVWSSVEIPYGSELVLGADGAPWPLPFYLIASQAIDSSSTRDKEAASGRGEQKALRGLTGLTLLKMFRLWHKASEATLPERVLILGERTVEPDMIISSIDKPAGGYVYEVTQPPVAERYFVDQEGFGELAGDVQGEISRLEEMLG